MTVVTITAVLATIAIPTFQGYVMKARTTEATDFIGVIKLRQESYRTEYGRYAQINSNATYPISGFAPDDESTMMSSATHLFPGGPGCDSACVTDWTQLGANPGGPVRFGYGIAAGLPGTEPAGLGYTTDHWYLIQAVSDLDGDGVPCTFEAYSQSKNVWYNPAKGWE